MLCYRARRSRCSHWFRSEESRPEHEQHDSWRQQMADCAAGPEGGVPLVRRTSNRHGRFALSRCPLPAPHLQGKVRPVGTPRQPFLQPGLQPPGWLLAPSGAMQPRWSGAESARPVAPHETATIEDAADRWDAVPSRSTLLSVKWLTRAPGCRLGSSREATARRLGARRRQRCRRAGCGGRRALS